MKITIEEYNVKAIYFSTSSGDYVDLLTEAAKYLDTLDLSKWSLLGMNRQSDDLGRYLTLFVRKEK